MKFTIQSKSLTDALALAQRVAPSRTTAPVLSCALIEARGGVVSITADNLSMRLTQRLEGASVSQEGAFCIPIRTLIHAIRGDQAEITVSGQRVTVISRGRSVMGCLPADEMKPWGLDGGETIVDMSTVSTCLKRVSGAVKNEANAMSVLHCINIDVPNKVIVATSGAALAVIPCDDAEALGCRILIMSEHVENICKVFGGQSEAKVSINGTTLTISDSSSVMNVKTFEGLYPNYAPLMGQKLDQSFTVSKKELLSAISAVTPFSHSGELMSRIDFNPKPEGLEIASSTAECESNELIPVDDMTLKEPWKLLTTTFTRVLSNWDAENLVISKNDQFGSFIKVKDADSELFCLFAPLQMR